MPATVGEVLAGQLAGFQQQELQRAPQRALGAEVGTAELLHELREPWRGDARLLPTGRAQRRARIGQRLLAVGAAAFGRGGLDGLHGGAGQRVGGHEPRR
jgi:hypothetical protein